MTTLKTFQQSELKRFDERVYMPHAIVDGDVCNADWFSMERTQKENDEWHKKHPCNCGMDKIIKTIKSFLNSAIEKAYSLSKEEKRKKITKKQVLDWLFDHDRNIYYQLLKNK